MAKARPIPGLHEDAPYALAAARVIVVRADELVAHSANVLDTADIERVHDMRVATRRLRAALELFEPCFPKKEFSTALTEVKRLADALGERRDRDVTIAALSEFTERIGRSDRPGVQNLIGLLRDEQQSANEELGPYVEEERLTALRDRIRALADEAEKLGATAEFADGFISSNGSEPGDQRPVTSDSTS